MGGDHLSGSATGRVELVRMIAVITGDWAQEVQTRLFFQGRLDDVSQHARRANRATLDLQEHLRGGNIARLALLTSHLDEVLRTLGEDFDSDDN